MTLEEAKLIRKGDHLIAANETKDRHLRLAARFFSVVMPPQAPEAVAR